MTSRFRSQRFDRLFPEIGEDNLLIAVAGRSRNATPLESDSQRHSLMTGPSLLLKVCDPYR